MSGIVGLVTLDGSPADPELSARLTASVRFRGPDGEGTWAEGPVGLGHTRLRTLEDVPDEGLLASPDGALWITADARVDDRCRLAAELAGHGQPCTTDASDARLLLHAYAAWGDDCPAHVLGDYAFAVWDRGRKRLFCAVVPFRIKPLFYAVAGGAILFVIGEVWNGMRRFGYRELELLMLSAGFMVGVLTDLVVAYGGA